MFVEITNSVEWLLIEVILVDVYKAKNPELHGTLLTIIAQWNTLKPPRLVSVHISWCIQSMDAFICRRLEHTSWNVENKPTGPSQSSHFFQEEIITWCTRKNSITSISTVQSLQSYVRQDLIMETNLI